MIGWAIVLSACSSESETNNEDIVYFCGAEIPVVQEDGSTVFEDGGNVFRSAETQSNAFAFEGDHSIKLDADHPYGLSIVLENVKKGEYFKASVWEKDTVGEGALIVVATGNTKFILSSNDYGKYEFERGWKKHDVQFKAVTDLDSLTFFVFAGGSATETYFDNLKIERYKTRPNISVDPSAMATLILSDTTREKIDSIIATAVQQEIISDDFKKYFNASWVFEGDTTPVEIRLKGDWTDHLVSGSVSYRIKTGDDFAFNGLTSFSIQHPKTRNYMHEWFMHQWFEKQGLLSTRYDFLPVMIDDNYEGVYAVEEHFDKQLLESRNRREGPILKMDESGFWAFAILERKNENIDFKVPYYQASIQSCFKEKRTLKSPALLSQFLNGSGLLNQFKMGYEHPELIFDIKQMATYYALMDMGNVRHSLAWHNRRFYYNPVTTKLEHIGFDMAPMALPLNPLLASEQFNTPVDSLSAESCLNFRVFQNPTFRKYYVEKLTEFSNPAFLDNLFAQLDAQISENEKLLQHDISGYSFNRAIYYEKAALVRRDLESIDERWDVFLEKNKLVNLPVNGKMNEYDLGDSRFYFKDISINAYRSKLDSGQYLIQLENYHFADVKVLGYTVKGAKDSLIQFDKIIDLKGFKGGSPVDTASIIIAQKPSRLLFEVANIPGEVKRKKFIKWRKVTSVHPRIQLHDGFETKSPYYVVEGENVKFRTGVYEIDELLYIPEGKRVFFEAGTTIDFVNQGGIILNDRTKMNGLKDAPIMFTSSDGTGMGITILQADSVFIEFVEVEKMGTLNYQGWMLTGALTIYESEVYINELKIHDNTCEDGLNVIRSNFEVKNCLIERTKSDGFDADFCTGSFSKSVFKNTGNDCIDFSGSVVDIQDIKVENSGDKGVSAGERSNLTLNNIDINGALTGLASKDGSVILGTNITVKNAEVGFAAFQKKPEYGFSTITLNGVSYQNLKRLGLIEKGSIAKVDGKSHVGYQKFDIDKMYARFGEK